MSDVPLVLLILVAIGWSYYVYVVQFCVQTLRNKPQIIAYLSIYHFFLAMALWCYFRVICSSIAAVPEDFRTPERIAEMESEKDRHALLVNFCHQKQITVSTRTDDGYIRTCKVVKPDRCHHCSKCRRCVLKMDHHCPWTNNCVNFSNYKYFVLFLFYINLYCLFIVATTARPVVGYFFVVGEHKLMNFHIIMVCGVSAFLELLLAPFFGQHVALTAYNRTTLESMKPTKFEDPVTFNVGIAQNFKQVFGNRCWCLWFLPVWSSQGDGVNFPTRQGVDRRRV